MDERLVLPAASTAADVLATAVTVPPLLGRQILFDAFDCASPLPSPDEFRSIANQLAALAGGEMLGTQHYYFTPHGLTLTAILSASHLAIHTWPEYNFVAVDIFTCASHPDFEAIAAYLKTALGCGRLERREMPRGLTLAEPDRT